MGRIREEAPGRIQVQFLNRLHDCIDIGYNRGTTDESADYSH